MNNNESQVSTYVVAIIVTYHPVISLLKSLLSIISDSVDKTIIVDNGSPENILQEIQQNVPESGLLISVGHNSGVAKAINFGIAKSDELSASHVLLLDQDSVPESNMVEELLRAMKTESESGYKVAAVGPKYNDVKGITISPFVRLKGLFLKRIECADNENVRVDHLITSGSLIAMDAMKDIGSMEEKLFIDYVDTEWCLRAMYKGYSLFGVGPAHMAHDIGDDFYPIGNHVVPVRTPLRFYYLIRNGLWLFRKPWVSLNWCVMDSFRLFVYYILCSTLVGKRLDNFKMMTKGIWHSLTGNMGKYDG